MSVVDEGELFGPLAVEFESKELQKLYADVREYEALINEVGISEDDVGELLGELDARWPYMNKSVRVTGNVIVATSVDDEGETTHLEPEYFDNEQVQSLGFNVLRMTDETGENLKWVMGHSVVFNMQVTSEQPMLKNLEQKRGFAPLNDVVIDYPFESQAAYFDKMHYRFPEVAQDIDTAILNASNESEAVKALQGIEIEVGPRDIPESFEVLEHYINSVISFDHKVPYQMQFGGKCYVIDAEAPGSLLPAEATPGFTLAYPLKVQLYFDDSGEAVNGQKQLFVRLGLRIVLINEDRSDDTERQYLIPIADDFDMHDVRSLVYIALSSQASNH